LDDIPAYVPSPHRGQVEAYFYTEVLAPRGRRFILDGSFPQVIVEETEAGEREYGAAELVELPLFHRIAAGAPGFMNERAEERFRLPREWFKGKELGRLFMLRVEGDSMTGVDIKPWRLRPGKKAGNGGEYRYCGGRPGRRGNFNRIFLIPKNKKYSRIELASDQARVLARSLVSSSR